MKTKQPLEINRLEHLNANGVKEVQIKAPNFQTAVFHIKGTAPLVIRRFSTKTAGDLIAKMKGGKSSSSKKNREPVNPEELFNAARYISKEGWDGFNASSIRNGMIRVCSLVNYKMTLAKMSIFCIQDGWDASEPQIPLVRIYGEPAIMQTDIGIVDNGNPCPTFRPAYHNWSAKVKIRWDADQFSLHDVTNLMARVGVQCGIGEGRPFSKNSSGMGWGTFEISNT